MKKLRLKQSSTCLSTNSDAKQADQGPYGLSRMSLNTFSIRIRRIYNVFSL
jgi:hypothetical protein